jgi:hypothetical protein
MVGNTGVMDNTLGVWLARRGVVGNTFGWVVILWCVGQYVGGGWKDYMVGQYVWMVDKAMVCRRVV